MSTAPQHSPPLSGAAARARLLDELDGREARILTEVERALGVDSPLHALAATRDELHGLMTACYAATTTSLRAHSTDREGRPRAATGDGGGFEPLRERARELARRGAPSSPLLQGVSLLASAAWRELLEIGAELGVDEAALTWFASELFTVADRSARELLDVWDCEFLAAAATDHVARSALVGSLLSRVPPRSPSTWEAAAALGLPLTGPYVVADGPTDADPHPLTGGRTGFAAAWRDTEDGRTGIIALPRGEQDLDRLSAELEGCAGAPLGLSPVFPALDDAPRAVVRARVAATVGARNGHRVTRFDQQSVAVVAAAAPELAHEVSNRVLHGLDGVDAVQRTMLIETFEAWLEAGGSTSRAATGLFLHRNTVRQRLGRFERLTGRSLSSPRDVAELCLAVTSLDAGPGRAG